MRATRRVLFALAAAAALPALVAWRPLGQRLSVTAESRLWVDGTSTVRRWTCKATAFDAAVEAADDAVTGVLAGQKAVRSVAVTVPVAKLDCSNGTMNEHMLKALKAREFPTITFRVASYTVDRGGDGVKGTLTGTLTLGGVTRPVAVLAAGRDAGGALRVAGSHELRMSEYGLKAPTLMLGAMKVHDAVKVGFDLVLRAEPRVANAN